MKIKRGWELFAAAIEVAIMAAVAVFGAVMIAVPVPILLHFLSKYGVTGTPGEGIFELYRRDAEAAAQRSKPQPAQTVPQPGSMEWFEAQKKKG